MRRRWLILAAVLLSVVGAGFVAVIGIQRHYDHNVERFADPFAGLNQNRRPTKPAGTGNSLNFLVLGSDSRLSGGNPAAWKYGAQRTDAIMILHVTNDHRMINMVSIPRDSWVTIPRHGKAKINAAYAWGGPALMVETVEKVTGVHIDHMVLTDFTAFTNITNTLGGVSINNTAMNGQQALAYVRERHSLTNGDLDRVKRQQLWMKAVATQLISKGTFTSPVTLARAMGDLTSNIAVDSTFTAGKMRSTAWNLRYVDSKNIFGATAPVTGSGMEGKQYVLYLDEKRAKQLWTTLSTT